MLDGMLIQSINYGKAWELIVGRTSKGNMAVAREGLFELGKFTPIDEPNDDEIIGFEIVAELSDEVERAAKIELCDRLLALNLIEY